MGSSSSYCSVSGRTLRRWWRCTCLQVWVLWDQLSWHSVVRCTYPGAWEKDNTRSMSPPDIDQFLCSGSYIFLVFQFHILNAFRAYSVHTLWFTSSRDFGLLSSGTNPAYRWRSRFLKGPAREGIIDRFSVLCLKIWFSVYTLYVLHLRWFIGFFPTSWTFKSSGQI